jgi:hypothetical protein
VSQLSAQLSGLPPAYAWTPHAFPPPVTPHPAGSAAKSSGTAALILGIISLPLAMCLVGWIFGILAILYSRRARGFGTAMIGRVFGIIGIVLSIGAGLAVAFALHHGTAP